MNEEHYEDPIFANLDIGEPIAPTNGANCPTFKTNTRRNPDIGLDGDHAYPVKKCHRVGTWKDICDPGYEEQPEEAKHKHAKSCRGTARTRRFAIADLHVDEENCTKDNLFEEAREAVNNQTSMLMAEQLQDARHMPLTASGDVVPSLQSTAIDLTSPAGAESPNNALTALLKGARYSKIIKPQFHFPLEAIQSSGGAFTVNGPITRTWTNFPVNPGPGLTGVGPDMSGNIDLTAAGEYYLYMTSSMVEWNETPVNSFDPGEPIKTAARLNRWLAEGWRNAAVRFNPYCVYAIRVCVREITCCGGGE